MYVVIIRKKVTKSLPSLPSKVLDKFKLLVEDLKESGPVQPNWMNYSKLDKDLYHCHLGYHYSACWKNENGTITIEVYYVGSRERAPY